MRIWAIFSHDKSLTINSVNYNHLLLLVNWSYLATLYTNIKYRKTFKIIFLYIIYRNAEKRRSIFELFFIQYLVSWLIATPIDTRYLNFDYVSSSSWTNRGWLLSIRLLTKKRILFWLKRKMNDDNSIDYSSLTSQLISILWKNVLLQWIQ